MDFLPVALHIRGQRCLVVGGGDVAARKVELLLRAGGVVDIVSPALCERLEKARVDNSVVHIPREYDAEDVRQKVLVIAATDSEAVNQQVAQDARKQCIPVNVVDRPALCTFTMPSIVDRSPVVVAVSTGGASPVLARLLRARLETMIPASFGRLATLLDSFRAQVKARLATTAMRRRFWEKVLQGPIAELVFAGREDEAKRALRDAVDEEPGSIAATGEVYLVGAGPGDPDLLTFRALRLLQQTDVILYDRLVSQAVLDVARRDADRIYVGKHRAQHAMRQEEINKTLVRLAKEGKRVLRLKGGDPFIFGRGGEEISSLAQEGISFQVVPGVTAAAGCASYAGIPLTHRDYAQSVMFVTGQLKDGSVDLNWSALVQPRQTVVIYMGLLAVDVICQAMIAHGCADDHPIAIIEKGTTPEQRVITGTLATMPAMIARADVRAPTLIIIGEVVKLRESLGWYTRSV